MDNLGQSDNRRGKVWGAIFVALYAATLASLFVWGTFRLKQLSEQQGMEVDFGTFPDEGSGTEDTALADDYVLPEARPAAPEEAVQTQTEEAPVIERTDIVTDKKPDNESVETEKNPTEEPKPKEVNARALFPGNTAESKSTSQGAAAGVGNQGSPNGTVSDNYKGSGETGFEPKWDLEGRRPRSSFPRPAYIGTDQGLVIVEIWVNEKGDVIKAFYRSKGSTVSINSPLVNEAIKAALSVKFDSSSQDIQVGTITYSFNLNTHAR